MTLTTLPPATLPQATLPVAKPRRRRPAPPPARPDWTCENCAGTNPGRRRRCWDCRTTRD